MEQDTSLANGIDIKFEIEIEIESEVSCTMSNLKYQTVEQLQRSKKETQAYIANLESSLNGQRTRLHWIDKYIFENTPQEMTMLQIESALGHKVIIR